MRLSPNSSASWVTHSICHQIWSRLSALVASGNSEKYEICQNTYCFDVNEYMMLWKIHVITVASKNSTSASLFSLSSVAFTYSSSVSMTNSIPVFGSMIGGCLTTSFSLFLPSSSRAHIWKEVKIHPKEEPHR